MWVIILKFCGMCHEQYITSKQEIFSGNIQTRVGLKPFMSAKQSIFIPLKLRKIGLEKNEVRFDV